MVKPSFDLERQHNGLVAGCDEVGRGPLAGPVVACALTFFDYDNIPQELLALINDSKKLTPVKREKIYAQLQNHKGSLLEYEVSFVAAEEIDRINILQASLKAMLNAVEALKTRPSHLLVDGRFGLKTNVPQTPVIKGDAISFSIAAASIIAKVTRDTYMTNLHQRYPQFDWASNKGYPTATHLAALKEHGPTEFHRKSFAPIKTLGV